MCDGRSSSEIPRENVVKETCGLCGFFRLFEPEGCARTLPLLGLRRGKICTKKVTLAELATRSIPGSADVVEDAVAVVCFRQFSSSL